MNKKAYIKPELMVEEFVTETMMISTSNNGSGYDTESDDFDQRSNDRRGSWGNLWDKGE